MSTLLTDLSSLLLTCAESTGGELPNYLKLHVLPHLPISPSLQVRLTLCVSCHSSTDAPHLICFPIPGLIPAPYEVWWRLSFAMGGKLTLHVRTWQPTATSLRLWRTFGRKG